MNREEIEELKEITIDLNDIDEIALGLEVCSKKSNMVIQEFIDTIVQLQQENQELKAKIKTYEDPEDLTLMFMYCDEKAKDKIKELKEVIDKAIKYIGSNDIEVLKYHDTPSETTSYEIVTVDLLKY